MGQVRHGCATTKGPLAALTSAGYTDPLAPRVRRGLKYLAPGYWQATGRSFRDLVVTSPNYWEQGEVSFVHAGLDPS